MKQIKRSPEKHTDGRNNAIGHYESILAQLEGINILTDEPCKDDEYEFESVDSIEYDADGNCKSVTIDGWPVDNCERLRDRILESALSVEVRSGWHLPIRTSVPPEYYRIVLSCGGPYLELRGELNFRAEPDSAELYYRWCNPETALSEAIEGKLLEWARNFYYGV